MRGGSPAEKLGRLAADLTATPSPTRLTVVRVRCRASAGDREGGRSPGGRLTLRQTVLQVVDDSSWLWLVLYTPALETDTAEKLQKLAINASGHR
jgi:hypothetical protein